MSRRPSISRNIAADPASIERIVGPVLAKRYLRNPAIAEYAWVLQFPGSKVVTSQRLLRALAKLPKSAGPILLAGDLTIEALNVAAEAGCDIVSKREPFWTDDGYLVAQRQPH